MKFYFIICFFLSTTAWVACKQYGAKEKPVNELLRDIPGQIKQQVYIDSFSKFTAAKAKLGRYLFYDNRISINNTKACASCHDPKFSFTDNYRRSIGAYGDLTQHNAPPLINLIFNYYLTAADSSLHYPEQQIHNPMFHEQPVELGWKNNEKKIIEKISTDSFYQQEFQKTFPEAQPVTVRNIKYAITSFIKTILSFHSPYDDFLYRKNEYAFSASAKRGLLLFQSSQLKCNQCHGGVNFNQPVFQETPYFNTGFFSDSVTNKGLAFFTKQPEDNGKYKVPTLRNLAFTAPYLHDGSIETLEQVINLYEQGGKQSVVNKHPFIAGFKLNSQQRTDLISFLLALSDSAVINNPAYANPWIIK